MNLLNSFKFRRKVLSWQQRPQTAGNNGIGSVKMEVAETKLETPSEFPFPFTPYRIQKYFMRNLYEAFEGKKLGIFESPTGTGKSMSLLCASLKWLLDAEKRLKDDIVSNIKTLNERLKDSATGVHWLDDHALQTKDKRNRDSLQTLLNKITAMECRIQEVKEKAKILTEKKNQLKRIKSSKLERNKLKGSIQNVEEEEEDNLDILLEDYTFDGEKSSESEIEEEEEDKNENYHCSKVFLCSRTHSQLSQLIKEFQKCPFKESDVRVVSLASRQNYCINDSVQKLNYLPLINDRCQDLLTKKKGKTTLKSINGKSLKRQKTAEGCPYYQQSNIETLKLKMLTEAEDIEQLKDWGKTLNGCPYYASRYSLNEAQLILVPYNTILHKSTRQAYGISLKNSVVIIDEAHNLLDAIVNIHSCFVNGLQLAQSYSQLVKYKDRYCEKFSPVNLLYLNQLIFIVNKLLRKIEGKRTTSPNSEPESKSDVIMETVTEFVLSSEIDTINFYKLLEFINKSKVVNKLRGFMDSSGPLVGIHKKEERKGVSAFLRSLTSKETVPEDCKTEESENMNGNPLLAVVSFIQALTNHDLDGRVVSTKGKTVGASSLKYLVLNPATYFEDVVKEARSVILAGGTMQPISEFTDQLFHLAGGSPERVSVFTCGHIIPEDHILPIIVSSGPSGKTFDFSYQSRSDTEVLDELGRLMINICNVIPAGIVCFFPSYEYENVAYQHFNETEVITKLTNKKKVFREPKQSSKVDEVLRDYAKAVKSHGALLFSVVGGKLSEGLNFSDDLGRCVIVVGLPYPNLTSPELKEKMNYLNEKVGPTAGKDYYENLCMKAVNQSIGRSVRHKNDYASVLLIDHRYSRSRCTKALPGWIQKSLKKEETFGQMVRLLAKFFSDKKKEKGI